MASHEQNMPFIKNLASSDRKLRTQALTSLQTFLGSHRSLARLDALKLWKGLFFAMWMCDRPIPQQNLAAELAGLTSCLRNADVPVWLAAFWETMSKQWTDIDVLRMEKFLLLVRRTFASGLQWVKEGSYAEGRRRDLLRVLSEFPFEVEGDLRKVPIGLRLHGVDIWVDELERAEMLGEEDEKAQAFAREVSQLVEPLKRSPIKTVRTKAAEALEDERLPWIEKKHVEEADGMDEDGSDDDDEWGGIEDK
ncbi:Ribosomal RNA-processing protein 1-like protein [Colletotrichum chlorophyti]|uniref:Ribosomal RNA-processing protein 1-like protein n=1 Tax=Colletotrichum chlorophyti TaxID=708187 RepID=A0A1Q8RUI2_9PEZI|nr:Ribosomal RNA-processing protein 1-like protein [Colletotrichum chlorophyti]